MKESQRDQWTYYNFYYYFLYDKTAYSLCALWKSHLIVFAYTTQLIQSWIPPTENRWNMEAVNKSKQSKGDWCIMGTVIYAGKLFFHSTITIWPQTENSSHMLLKDPFPGACWSKSVGVGAGQEIVTLFAGQVGAVPKCCMQLPIGYIKCWEYIFWCFYQVLW